MRNVLLSFAAGLLFGLGLIVGGMANPAKVLGFLDLAGAWDPSLAMVMAGATALGAVAFAFAARMKTSLLGLPMRLPAIRDIDRRLVGGSLLFGIGWGLAGICPGPALVLLGTGALKGLVFAAAMVAGMMLFTWLERGAGRRESGVVPDQAGPHPNPLPEGEGTGRSHRSSRFQPEGSISLEEERGADGAITSRRER